MRRKKFLEELLLIFIICLFVSRLFLWNENGNTKEYVSVEKFLVNKVIYYSDVNALNNSKTYQNPEWDLDVYQYTDIMIFIDRISEEESYIQKLFLNDIEFGETSFGKNMLLYQNPILIGKPEFDKNNIIENELDINIFNSENVNNDMNYDLPVFFQDCSIPITIRYIKDEIVKKYIVSNDKSVKFDGSLLKNNNIKLTDIQNCIKLRINVVTNDDIVHEVQLNLNIPLKNENEVIYNSSIKKIEKLNIGF